MDPDATAESVLEPGRVESVPIIIPVHDAPAAIEQSAAMPKVSPMLHRPQSFVSHHMPQKRARDKARRRVFLIGVLLVVATGVFTGVRAFLRHADSRAAMEVSDSFVAAEFGADSEKAMAQTRGTSIKEADLKALAVLLAPTLKAHPVRTDQDLQQRGDKPRAVFVYRFTITNPKAADQNQENPVYLVTLLQKDSGAWKVRNQTMSSIDPKADIASYSAQHFEGNGTLQ